MFDHYILRECFEHWKIDCVIGHDARCAVSPARSVHLELLENGGPTRRDESGHQLDVGVADRSALGDVGIDPKSKGGTEWSEVGHRRRCDQRA